MAGLAGPTLPCTLSFISRAKRARMTMHENVKGMPPIVAEGLSDTHRCWEICTEPADEGYGKIVQRSRRYRIFAKKHCRVALL